MQGGWLANLATFSIPLLGLGALVAMLLGAAAGRAMRQFTVKKHAGSKPRESGESVAQEGYLLASMLGLLGLLMAFSFGMVIERYESRRDLGIKHANAIGTAYLRVQLLDEPHRSRLSRLLVDYTANRIRLSSGVDRNAAIAVNDRLLIQIWAAVKAARDSAMAHGLTTALLMTVNDVVDLDTERNIAGELRLPPEVLTLLGIYLVITAGVAGYHVDGPRGRRAALVLFVLVSFSLAMLADINRPMSGEEQEVHKPLLMLLASMQAQPPQAFDRYAGSGKATLP
jgi:hypothetical protein